MKITRDCKQVKDIASLFHYGVLGIEKTSQDVREAIQKILDSGYTFDAFNCEMIHSPLAEELIGNVMRIHVPISYPMGNLTLKKKLIDLEYCARIGVDEDFIYLNYGAIASHNYNRIEEEVRACVDEFESTLDLTFVIQATLLNDVEIIDVCWATGNGGGTRIKLNTRYGWETTLEEVALIRREFGYQFDLHPSGNIKTWKQVRQFLELGMNNIHSLAVYEILDEYIALRNAGGEAL